MTKDYLIRSNLFTRRAFILLAGKLSFMSILIGRLFYLQIIKYDEYSTLSENNRIRIIPILAKRGIITDCKDKILAVNRDRYQILISKVSDDEVNKIIEKIAFTANLDADYMKLQLKKKKNQQFNDKIIIYDDLSWEDLIKLEVQLFDLENVNIEVSYTRHYPYNLNSAHIIGYIATDPYKNIANLNLKCGKAGIEKYMNDRLSGQVGIKKIEVNAYGKITHESSQIESVDGEKIKLSLDIRLQNFIMNMFNGHSAASVVIDINNGNILAMASNPSFDANLFNNGISNDYWKEISNDKNFPLINRTISSQYPPGSIYKLIVAIAALENNISPDLEFECVGYVDTKGRRFHCSRHIGHGFLNLVQAILHSCNCYFFNIAKKLEIEKIAAISDKFGLGKRTGVEIDNEIKGLIPDRNWKKQKFNKEWQIGDSFNASIGQGYVLTTPIQLAALVAKIASSKNIVPSLIYQETQNFNYLDIKSHSLEVIRNAMDKVTNHPGGSGYKNRIIDGRIKMAGKTGTSQVISKKNLKDDLSRIDIVKSNRNHSLFVCYAPVHEPRYACSVVVENGGNGGNLAASIAKNIMIETQKLNDSDL